MCSSARCNANSSEVSVLRADPAQLLGGLVIIPACAELLPHGSAQPTRELPVDGVDPQRRHETCAGVDQHGSDRYGGVRIPGWDALALGIDPADLDGMSSQGRSPYWTAVTRTCGPATASAKVTGPER